MRTLLLCVLIAAVGAGARLCYIFASIFWIEGDRLSACLIGAAPLLVLAVLFVPNHPDME
jgi:hypothetical protein